MEIDQFISEITKRLDDKTNKNLIFEFKDGDLYINNKGNEKGPTVLAFNQIGKDDFKYQIDLCVEYIKAYHSNGLYFNHNKTESSTEEKPKETYVIKKTDSFSNSISKELFVETINVIRNQMAHDSLNSKVLAQEFGQDSALASFNDNSKLIKNTIQLLQIFFPKDEKGFCEIEHYIFFCNFGKPSSDSEYVSPEMLYEKLIK